LVSNPDSTSGPDELADNQDETLDQVREERGLVLTMAREWKLFLMTI
jgi:hypothetical protein